MASLNAARILCAVLVALPFSLGRPFNVGLCEDWHKPCQCGTPGYTFHLQVKQCSHFYQWRLYCKPCVAIDENLMCQPYTHCHECNPNIEGCVKCPVGRYGRLCHMECKCQNGGVCDDSGRCSCPVGFEGLKCEKQLECGQPFLNDHLIIRPMASTYPIQTDVHFQCEEGFLLEGATQAHCNDNRRWSTIAPICLPLCKELLIPDHGTANLPLGRIVPGTIVTFLCNKGFAISGPSSRRCQEDGTWSRLQPTCVPAICCSQPSIPENSIILGSTVTSHFSPGQSLSLHCNDGFVLVGDATMTCKETGKWSQEPPRCVREEETCLNPGPLVNGKIKVSEGPHGVHVHLLGTQLQFSCDPLHFLAGHSKTTCQGNRTWSSPFPTCKKVITCGALEQFPSVRMRFVKPETAARTIKTFSQSNVMTRRTGKGRFRSNVRPQAAAPQPRHQADLEMILPEGFYHIGTQANFYCESPYYQLQGSQTRTCMNNGEWTGRPTTCTPICGISSDPVTPTVYGGSASSIGQWPWMVAINMIDDDGEHFFMCGGSLVDERWVITAAHCVTHENKTKLFSIDRFVFYAGKYHLDNSLDDKEVQVREAEAIHLHPDYNPKTFDSDLALIRLAQPVKLTSRVQPVCLPSTDPIKSQERMNNRRGVVRDCDVCSCLLHSNYCIT